MGIEFRYVSDEKLGRSTINLLKGKLSESQKELLIDQINQNVVNSYKRSGTFAPVGISGLPENIVFIYTYESLSSSRSSILIFREESEEGGSVINIDTSLQIPLTNISDTKSSTRGIESPVHGFGVVDISGNVSSPEVKQSEWVDLYFKELNESITQILNYQVEHHEKIGLEYSLDEFARSLKEGCRENSLFLFSIYLQNAVQQFSQEDKEKSGLFSLAIRALEKYKQHNKPLE